MFTVRPGLCLFVAGALLLDACGAPVSIEVDRKERHMTLDDVVASIP